MERFEIRLAPNDPRADIAARCNQMLFATLGMILSMDTAGGPPRDTRLSAFALAIVSIRAACAERLKIPVELLRGSTASAAGVAADAPPQTEIAVDLRDGPVRFSVPLAEATLTVTTPAGTVVSQGKADFSAAYSTETGTLALAAHSGAVDFRPAILGAQPTRLQAGQRFEFGSPQPAAGRPVDYWGGAPMPSPPAAAKGCGLGRLWRDTEDGWSGTWVRRGDSNFFDATWTNGNASDRADLQISLSGQRVHILRTPRRGQRGLTCAYDGTLAPDGVNVSGTYICPGQPQAKWNATIVCDLR